MVSSPLRAILLLSYSSPRRGTPLFQVHGALEKTIHFEEAGLWLDGFLDITCIRLVDVNICLYKSINQLWNYWEIIGE